MSMVCKFQSRDNVTYHEQGTLITRCLRFNCHSCLVVLL